MALHNLTITVVDGGVSSEKWGSSSLKESKKTTEKSKLSKMFHYNQTIKNKIRSNVSPTTFYAMQRGVGLAVQTGKQAINYYVSDIGRRNGDSNYQAIVNRRIEQVTDITSVASGAYNGAAAGSLGGIVGVAIGAALGAASAGINLGFKYAEKERSYQHEMFKEKNSQAYGLARANYSAMTGRVR